MHTPLLVTVLLASVVLAGCNWGKDADSGFGPVEWSSASTASVGPAVGQRAPNFRLKTSTGETIELAQLAGRPIVVNFFATWCTNCRDEMAVLQAASASTTPVNVIGVDLRESASVVADLAADAGVRYPLALDSSGSVSRAYRATSLPVTYVLDGAGIVREIVRGPIDAERLASAIATAGLTT
jgi:peroxiredoxin